MKALKFSQGERYGLLTVLQRAGHDKWGAVTWKCLCDCGNLTEVSGTGLRKGSVVSCGCRKRIAKNNPKYKHGLCRHPLHIVWQGMHQRCNDKNAINYVNYGGRGITVCPEWGDFQAFYDWAITNNYKKGLTIERINNDGPYAPWNCRWATRKEQSQNMRQRRNSRWITAFGKTQTLTEWGKEIGIRPSCLWLRIFQYHWPVERALTEPLRTWS